MTIKCVNILYPQEVFMTDAQKWQLIIAAIGLVTGGLAGALFNAYLTNRKNRIQPIGKRVELITIFENVGTNPTAVLNSKITITKGTIDYQFKNLFLYEIQLANRGSLD